TGPFKRRRETPKPVKEEGRPVLRLAGKPTGGKGGKTDRKPAGRTAVPAKNAKGRPATTATGRAGTSTRNAKGRPAAPAAAGKGTSAAARRRRRPTEATEELRRFAGGNANRATETLERATEAFARGRERDALRILRP